METIVHDPFLRMLAGFFGMVRHGQYDVCSVHALAAGIYAVRKRRFADAELLLLNERTREEWVEVYFDGHQHRFQPPPDHVVGDMTVFCGTRESDGSTMDAVSYSICVLDFRDPAHAFRDHITAWRCALEWFASQERWHAIPVDVTVAYHALEREHAAASQPAVHHEHV
ncbi:MAG: hypothetical protein Q7T01_02775 [bacterium]|nr:hypothetical protein [bacterium]